MCVMLATQGEGLHFPQELAGRSDVPATVERGERTEFATGRKGKVSWTSMRLGLFALLSAEKNLISNVMIDRVGSVSPWHSLIRQRCAIPVFGYRLYRRSNWTETQPAWALGLYDVQDEAGVAIISEDVATSSRPVLVDGTCAIAWLKAEQWEALGVLNGAPRISTAFEGPKARSG